MRYQRGREWSNEISGGREWSNEISGGSGPMRYRGGGGGGGGGERVVQ